MGPGETPVATIINDIAFKPPRAPPLTELEGQEYFCENTDYCKSESKANESRPCSCTHVKNIPLGSIVEVVIYDQGKPWLLIDHKKLLPYFINTLINFLLNLSTNADLKPPVPPPRNKLPCAGHRKSSGTAGSHDGRHWKSGFETPRASGQ